MQSRASPFPRSFFSIASIFGVLTENTNQVLSAASLLSDHRLVFSSSTSPPPPPLTVQVLGVITMRALKGGTRQNLEDRTSQVCTF